MNEDNLDYTTRLSDSTDPMPVIQENCYSLRQDLLDNATNLSSVWHKGSEKPSIYKDGLTGYTLRTYALCIIWYDGWIEDLCRVTDDHKFASCTSDEVYDSEFFEYWAYTHDLIPKDL
jgi:hypothetical protein